MQNEFFKKIASIQKKLKAPKNQKNNLGNYKYRNCEDILEAVKPLLDDLIMTITDEIVQIGDRYYVKATVKIQSENQSIENSAYARESEIKKGMDESQITGASSSYARKYALNGLLLIDDTKDADTQDNTKDNKLTDMQLKGMLKFIQEGKANIVKKKMTEYEITEAQKKILNTAIQNVSRETIPKEKTIKEQIKDEIIRTNPIVDMSKKEEIEKYILEKTGLELKEENYIKILEELKK